MRRHLVQLRVRHIRYVHRYINTHYRADRSYSSECARGSCVQLHAPSCYCGAKLSRKGHHMSGMGASHTHAHCTFAFASASNRNASSDTL